MLLLDNAFVGINWMLLLLLASLLFPFALALHGGPAIFLSVAFDPVAPCKEVFNRLF